MFDCEFCPYKFSEFEIQKYHCCPHCGNPSLFPNVMTAASPAEENVLHSRYINAKALASARGIEVIIDKFEGAVANESHAVLVPRNRYEVNELVSTGNETYPTFYALINAGIRPPGIDRWKIFRSCVDEKLFPYYKENIHFAALSLDGFGVLTYGGNDPWKTFSLIFDEQMIVNRASVFEKNSRLFQEEHHIETTQPIPYGYCATWAKRAKLAIAKLVDKINSYTHFSDFPILLLRNTGVPEKEEFIEVHIFGPITIRTFKEVVVKKASFLTRLEHRVADGSIYNKLKDKLRKYGVSYREQP